MKLPLVSVIIPVYNRAHLIREALDSVAAQEYPNLEIVLVDDGSKDAEALKEAVDAFAATFAGTVRLVRQDNAGAGAARNHGLRVASGEMIQYLDSDDLLLPGKIRAHVEALQADPEAVMVYGVALEQKDDGTQVERKLARDYVPDLLEATLQWRRWSTNGALWRYTSIPDWQNRAWWGTSRAGQDVVHDVRVGCEARKILFVDAPATLVRIVTNDHTSHSKKRDLTQTRWQVIDDCQRAMEAAGLLNEPRYARPFAERCLHAGLFLAVHDHEALGRDVLRRAFRFYPDWHLKLDAGVALLASEVLRWPGRAVPRERILRAFFRRRRALRPTHLHVNRTI